MDDLISKNTVLNYLNDLLDGRFKPHENAMIQVIRDNIKDIPAVQNVAINSSAYITVKR